MRKPCVFSNLDAWLLGTHHGVSRQHLQAYLNEYVFRFNRRFWPMAAFDSVLGLALWALAKTYERSVPVFSGPLYKSMKIDGNKIRIDFDHVGSGLVARDGNHRGMPDGSVGKHGDVRGSGAEVHQADTQILLVFGQDRVPGG